MTNTENSSKCPAASHTSMTEIVLPNDANVHGNILGGKVMHLVDLAGAIAAYRHCRMPVVTASVDSMIFHHPIKVGHLVLLEAQVNRAFGTSMEVEVTVCSENPISGKRLKTSTAFLTFVALDDHGRPTQVPPIVPETEQDKKRYEAALVRRELRLQEARRASHD